MFRDFVLILTMLASLINLSMFVNPQVAAWIRDALYR